MTDLDVPESTDDPTGAAPDGPVDPPDSGSQDAATADPFNELVEWVSEVLAPVINRDFSEHSSLVWCPQWWQHPEVVARLAALQDAWTVLVADEDAKGDGPSTWWVRHVDEHLAVILNADTGPFSRCKRGHKDTANVQPLQLVKPPSGAVRLPVASYPFKEPDDAATAAAALDHDDPDDAGTDPS